MKEYVTTIRIKVRDSKNMDITVISSSSIRNMDPNETIFVNRVRINSKMMEYQMIGKPDENIEKILLNAKKEMRKQEIDYKKPSIGAKMTIRDILKIFTEPEKMENNSFFAIKEC